MKYPFSLTNARLGVLALAMLPLTGFSATEFGTVLVTQLDGLNNASSVSLSLASGASPGSVLVGGNRGDYDLDFGYTDDSANGVPITSIAQISRNDSAVGGPATGPFFATSAFDRSTSAATLNNYYIAIHWAEVNDSVEVNYNVSFGFFPYSEWLSGVARNTANNGTMTGLTGSTGLVLGTHFVDLASPGGFYSLDLTPFAPDASLNGVLLVNGAKNEDNYALSRANSDGTFNIISHDSGANTSTYENDGVGFVYLPAGEVGTKRLAAIGRVNGDASTDVAAGNFTVIKGGTGQWYITIPGHTNATGTLIVSPEGAGTNNVDNIVAAGWDAANSRWIVESRDLTGVLPQVPGLQNMATADEDAFSFAFLTTGGLNPPPVVTLAPASGSNFVEGAPITLGATATDDTAVVKVGFYDGDILLAEDVEVPYEYVWTGAALGNHKIKAKALDDAGTVRDVVISINVTPPPGTDGLFFDGADDHVTFGDAAALKLGSFTLECWFKRRDGGVAASTGSGGVSAIPLITKGRGQSDGTNVDCNYFMGIEASTGKLAADFEDLATGLNHPAVGNSVIPLDVWQHAAATFDSTTHEWRLYLNGTLEAVVSTDGQVPRNDSIQHAGLGTAMNSTGVTEGAFLGFMDEARIWNRARSLGEIQAALNQQIPSESGLVARYAMNETSGLTLSSSAGIPIDGTLVNGVFRSTGAPFDINIAPTVSPVSPADDATEIPLAVTLEALVADFDDTSLTVKFYGRSVGTPSDAEDFTVVALPDTQYYSENVGGTRAAIFSAQTDWIVAEKETRNTAFVLHLGDITEHGDNPDTALTEWTNATNAMYRLENPETTLLAQGIPYSVAVGNHDQTPIGNADGSTTNFNTYFGVHPQTGTNHFAGKNYYGGTQVADSADNNYTFFSASGLDFIVISFEYDTTPDAADLEWADALLKAHPTRRGIIVTHHMVNIGNPASFSGQGLAIYEALKDNPNLLLMHGGHIHGEGRRTDTFEGRTVHSILADFQGRANGGDGWLRIMKFRPSVNRIEVQSYSPTLEQFETDADSEFVLDVDLQGTGVPFTLIDTVTAAPGTVTAAWNGLVNGTTYQWYAEVSDGVRTAITPVSTFTTIGTIIPPSVAITGPANGTTVTAPGTFALTADAADIDGTVSKVGFYSGTTLLGEDNVAPYAFDWTDVAEGSYTVLAKATDNQGNETTSDPISLVVLPGLPVVTIAATDAVGGEFGGDNELVFTASRTGSTTAGLSVNYTTSGTANISDHSALSGTIDIPAGQASAEIPVTILADALAEGDETLAVVLTDEAGYDIGSPSGATATIADRPFQAYLHANQLGAPNGDDDNDGDKNLVEYYMGSQGDDSSSRGTFRAVSSGNGTFTARFPRSKTAVDVSASVEWSTDLVNWQSSGESSATHTATVATAVVSPAEENPETLEAVLTITAGEVPQGLYLRLAVAE